MNNQYRLESIRSAELVSGLSHIVQQSNELTADLLAHLGELEGRMLHLELGYSSLFAYCVQALGMSEGAAGRRVAASHVCRRFPEAFARVASGELHLSALCVLGPHLTPENATELLDACGRRSRRQIEELLAARFPKADIKEQIRRLPERTQAAPLAHSSRANSGGPVAPSAAEGASGPVAISAPGAPASRSRELEPLSPERFGVHFTADLELRELIERARALASHRLPKGELSGLMKIVLRSFVEREEARRFAVGRKSRNAKAEALKLAHVRLVAQPTPPGGASGSRSKRSRHIPAETRRAVHARDAAQCSFVSNDGRRCDARALLEYDHLEPWAVQGSASVDNIRLRCRAHNQMHARNCFGSEHVAAKIAERRREASLSNETRHSDV